MKRKSPLVLTFVLNLAIYCSTRAAVIIDQPNIDIGGGGRVPGQSFITPNDGIADTITEVGFGKSFTAVPSGRVFLLNQEYSGRPQDLSISTTGYLAQSDLATSYDFYAQFAFTGGNQYTLSPNTKYWVYSNSATGWNLEWNNSNPYAGGDLYMAEPQAVSPLDTYGNMGASTSSDFKFYVSATAVPEPSTYAAMFGVGLLGFATLRKTRPQWLKRSA